MKIVAVRGASYLIKKNGKYALVDIDIREMSVWKDSPGSFLKVGYFQNVDVVSDDVKKIIDEVVDEQNTLQKSVDNWQDS